MAIVDLQHVQPGNLITAAFVNQLIDELAALEGRVVTLESEPDTTPTPAPGPPVLTHRQPTGTVRVGSLLTLFGQNFAPLSQAQVNMGGATITSFGLGSGNTRLSFQVPALSSLPRNVSITVETPLGTSNALTGVRVEEQPPVQAGEVFVDDLTEPLAEIEVGETYTLTWRVRSETLLPVTYDFSIVLTAVDPVDTLDDWEAAIELSDEQQQVSAASPYQVTATFEVPAGANAVTIALRAESTDDQFAQTSPPVTLIVGETPELSDPRVQLVPLNPQPFDPETGDPNPVHRVAGVYEIEFGASGIVPVEIQLQPDEEEGGRYRFSAEIEDDGGGDWVLGPISPAQILLDPGGETTVNYGIENAGTSGSPPPETFLVARAVKRTAADDADVYTSFTRIPIRGGDGT